MREVGDTEGSLLEGMQHGAQSALIVIGTMRPGSEIPDPTGISLMIQRPDETKGTSKKSPLAQRDLPIPIETYGPAMVAGPTVSVFIFLVYLLYEYKTLTPTLAHEIRAHDLRYRASQGR